MSNVPYSTSASERDTSILFEGLLDFLECILTPDKVGIPAPLERVDRLARRQSGIGARGWFESRRACQIRRVCRPLTMVVYMANVIVHVIAKMSPCIAIGGDILIDAIGTDNISCQICRALVSVSGGAKLLVLWLIHRGSATVGTMNLRSMRG